MAVIILEINPIDEPIVKLFVMVVFLPTKGGSYNPGKQLVWSRGVVSMPNGILNTSKTLLVLNLVHEF